MAKNTATVNTLVSTDAEFRAIVALMEGVFASGLTRTTDTGQINPVTVTKPTAAIAGYGIFEFNDTLAATKPVKFKIEYGHVASIGLDLWITVGTGSDGAGNITGIIFPRTRIVQVASSTTTNSTPTYVSAKSNWVCWDFQSNTSNTRMQFSLERSLDVNGSSNGNGIYIVFNNFTSASSYRGQFIPFTGTVPGTETVPSTNPPSGQTSGLASDNSIAVFPLYFYDIGRLLPPSRCFCGVFNSNITQGVETAVEISGQSQNMLGGQNYSWLVNPVITSYAYLMRYEA